jgi:flagellin
MDAKLSSGGKDVAVKHTFSRRKTQMAMSINHNISAINTRRTLNTSSSAMGKSLQKLSSGYRINVGSDGPADLVISEQLRAQTVGLERAVRNTMEASNVIGIAEGALNEMNSILKTMRSLALHASNNGITSPQQVAADQSEVDSAIQTIDRIANTTKYSDQFLLNGGKQLNSTRTTLEDKVTDTNLLDLGLTRIDQIFKKEDFAINFTFSGATTNAETAADETVMAKRAYFEANASTAGTDIDATNNTTISSDQRFTITGENGARTFSFANGTHIGEISEQINNLSDSTGVGSTLIFDNDVTGTGLTGVETAFGVNRVTLAQTTYHVDSSYNSTDSQLSISAAVTGAVAGTNTDGDGRLYLKWSSATAYTAYKDRAMTIEVGTGTDGVAMTASNSSGLAALIVDVDANAPVAGEITIVDTNAAGALELDDTGVDVTGMAGLAALGLGTALALDGGDVISGVRLGQNTDETGTLYYKFTGAANAKTVSVYKDANMAAEDLVMQTNGTVNLNGAADTKIKLYETNGSGLFSTMNFDDAGAGLTAADATGSISFTNLGVRLYSEDYGSDAFVKVDAHEGALFADASDNIVDAGLTGATDIEYGQNAKLTVNGLELQMNGLEAEVSTQDMNAKFVFNEGELGKTTIAVVGYDQGAVASRAGQLDSGVNSQATKAMHNTGERLDDFTGGMQFQLGEGAGDQERTVYSIQSMAVAKLGQVKFTDDFDSTGVTSTKLLGVSDLLGGSYASLAVDPIKALTIIDKAIEDVSTLRARLGAFQKNMLQTNANSLNVAIENITATESSIRDADMAFETAEFTKNQILVQAGTAMLAQANAASQNVLAASQNVLQLLG